jgi:hypothetical protein
LILVLEKKHVEDFKCFRDEIVAYFAKSVVKNRQDD